MIIIAHPDFRNELQQQAKQCGDRNKYDLQIDNKHRNVDMYKGQYFQLLKIAI